MSKSTFSMGINDKEIERRLGQLRRRSPAAFAKAMEVGALEFLLWCNEGSSNESRKPPIQAGFLRGSSSAFLDGKMLGLYPNQDNREANRSYGGKGVTWGWNANYAARLHELDAGTATGYKNPGEATQRDGDAGNKWLEKHLQNDKEAFMDTVARRFKKELGT